MSKFEIKTTILKDVLESFRKMHTEIIFEFTDEDIFISTRNQSHSLYMKARIVGSSLQNYVSECNRLIFDLTNLREFLDVYPENNSVITITENAVYVGKEKNFLFYVFSEEEFFEIPKIKVLYECSLEKENLLQVLKELRVFSGFFKLEASIGDLRLFGEDKIKGQGKIVLKIPKIDEEFEGIFSLQPLLDILNDVKIENNVNFRIFENNVIGFSFKKHEIAFEIYIAEHTGEKNTW
ncbi:MAG: hypothetical protein HXS48_16070 [Theionarchaea archaeon]|nr:hypothetical protein [Theionarchaea archaeon]